jgi:hypothetical protein
VIQQVAALLNLGRNLGHAEVVRQLLQLLPHGSPLSENAPDPVAAPSWPGCHPESTAPGQIIVYQARRGDSVFPEVVGNR